jgi:hypothetical protein
MSLQLAITVIVLADLALIVLATLVMSRAKLLTPHESIAGDGREVGWASGLIYLTSARSADARGTSRQGMKVST